MSDCKVPRAYRLVGMGDSGKRVTIASGATLEDAIQIMNEFTAYPLFSRLTIEDEETGEPKGEWFRP